jgi:deoxyribonuclease-4
MSSDSLLIGAHVSAAGGIDTAPARALSIGANTLQIFSANQRQWTPRQPTESEITNWREQMQIADLSKPIVHASYLINMSAIEAVKLERSRSAFISELQRSEALGVHGVVLHPGSHLGAGEDEGVRAVAESLDVVFEEADTKTVRVLLENTAGQGTNLGWRLEHLSDIKKAMKVENRQRIGVCFDTCHAFAAGYDLVSDEGWAATWDRVDETIGFAAIEAIHLNDSKQPLDSRRDRHESLGKGELGSEPFRRFAQEERFRSIPMVLETPSGMDGWAEEIAIMRAWARESD